MSVCSTFSKVRQWFAKLSFWKKIIIIFTLNTLILLIITDTIMLILFGKISDDVLSVSNAEKDQFNLISNTQVAGSAAKMMLSKFDLYANYLAQLLNVYKYFSANPQLYTSKQGTNPQLPLLTQSFGALDYAQPAIFFFSNASTFYSLSYVDQILSKMIRNSAQIANIKRVNVYIQDVDNLNDLTVRTLPGTNSFNIPSLDVVNWRFKGSQEGFYTISDKYTDQLSKNGSDTLFAIRSTLRVQTNMNISLRVLAEIQLSINLISNSLKQIYYFPSAEVIFVKLNLTTRGYSLYYSTQPATLDYICDFVATGTSQVSLSSVSYLGATIGLTDTFKLGSSSTITNKATDPFRITVLVKASQGQMPANLVQNFLHNQARTLQGIVFGWSTVILLSTIALATVVGNYIFSNLKMLSTKMKEYIKEPSRFHEISFQLKQLQIKGILKKLTDNLVSIIQKIQCRKKQRKDRVSQNYHPLNIGEPEFQKRQELNDYEILESLKKQIRDNTEASRNIYNQSASKNS